MKFIIAFPIAIMGKSILKEQKNAWKIVEIIYIYIKMIQLVFAIEFVVLLINLFLP